MRFFWNMYRILWEGIESFLDLDGFAIYDWIGRKMGGKGILFSRDGMFLMVFLYGKKVTTPKLSFQYYMVPTPWIGTYSSHAIS